jgi:spore germination cell wall hydrolase CwlJ-like protein
LTERLALGRVPAIAFLLALSGLAAPASAQVAAAAATPVAVTATPVANAAPIASAPVLQVTPAPAATTLQPVAQGRAAILSSTPRPNAGVTPPTGTADVRPAVTHAGLWPMVWAKTQTAAAALTEQEECIAIAVYHEARGEPLDGQLAVAEVIMNRAASGRYPASWCEVVKQPWQFSFVNPRSGRIPAVNRDSASWAYAQAITRIAVGHFADALPGDVLWYHADYVAPSWGRRLAKVEKIGAHIFYRAS